jgi:hypothetical protein
MTRNAEMDELVSFLIEAKRLTYAAGGGASKTAVASLLPGSHQLEHRRDAYLYRDIYFGEARFAGQETAYRDGKPVWTMCYAGGYTDPALPGTKASEIGAAWFHGKETIARNGEIVYRLQYAGGLLA